MIPETSELTYRILLGVMYLGLFAVLRVYYHVKGGIHREKKLVSDDEGKTIVILRAIFAPLAMLIILSYIFFPRAIAWAAIPLPDLVRWLGVGMVALSIPLTAWVQWALGANFSGTLRIRDDHTLVTHGPYRWVRHPMYTIFFFALIPGMALLTSNGLFFLFEAAGVLIVMIMRTPREEAMMIDRFGQEYRLYMKQTGRYWPRLRLPRDLGPQAAREEAAPPHPIRRSA